MFVGCLMDSHALNKLKSHFLIFHLLKTKDMATYLICLFTFCFVLFCFVVFNFLQVNKPKRGLEFQPKPIF